MKATELMIGDWVQCNYWRPSKQLRVAEIRRIMDDETKIGVDSDGTVLIFKQREIDPIPLTAELLEQNGFYSERNTGYVYEDGEYEVIVDLWNNGYRILYNRDVMVNIHRFCDVPVHELQHALRLCGIDKEIIIKED